MKGFFELLYEEPTKLMILGASCSVVSQPVAETSQHWNMVQVGPPWFNLVCTLKVVDFLYFTSQDAAGIYKQLQATWVFFSFIISCNFDDQY